MRVFESPCCWPSSRRPADRIFPLFVEGAESPADDVLDFGVGAALAYLLGWHWEFLPSFLGKLVPESIWCLSGALRPECLPEVEAIPAVIEGSRETEPTGREPRG